MANFGLFAQTASSIPVVNTTTFNTTISNTLDITAEWGAASTGNSISTEVCVLNKIY